MSSVCCLVVGTMFVITGAVVTTDVIIVTAVVAVVIAVVVIDILFVIADINIFTVVDIATSIISALFSFKFYAIFLINRLVLNSVINIVSLHSIALCCFVFPKTR